MSYTYSESSLNVESDHTERVCLVQTNNLINMKSTGNVERK